MKKISFLILLLTFNAYVFAQDMYTWKFGNTNGYKYKYVLNDPTQAHYYTLSNGLTVILSVNKKTPRIQTLIGTRAGSNNDPKDHTGLAHYLEHMLFKGTDKYGSLDWGKEKPLLDQIENLYDQYGKIAFNDTAARRKKYHEIDSVSGLAAKYAIANEYDKMMSFIGSQATNAHTSVEETVYQENIPSNAIDKFLAVQAERFRNPVLRLFHTELEAVYEEKNRHLDNDQSKMISTLLANLFPTHNYGQQTTIGTVEHLKNPSLIAIKKFYDDYYVPNNMALVMVGDFNEAGVIKKIDESFAWWKPKSIKTYNGPIEQPIKEAVQKEVYGPTAETVWLGWRMPSVLQFKENVLLEVVVNILYNDKAGLIDLNINQQQKLLSAFAGNFNFKDYGLLFTGGMPKQGQTLDEVKQLLLDQISMLQKGNFDESLIASTVANYKLDRLVSLQKIAFVANMIMDDFIKSKVTAWDKQVAMIDAMQHITKKDIMDFTSTYITNNNYVAIYKRKGTDTSIAKVPKPSITPIEVNRNDQSAFLNTIEKMPTSQMEPVFVDYKKEIQQTKIGSAKLYYTPNKDNNIFRLYYRFNVGKWNNKALALAIEYLPFLSTGTYTANQINELFYKLACSYTVNVEDEYTTVYVTGLQENFDKAVNLFEHVLNNCKPDAQILNQLIQRTKKQRLDAKLNKDVIKKGLSSYAMYSLNNPFNYVLSNKELDNLQVEDLVSTLHTLSKYQHDIVYYGPKAFTEATAAIKKLHVMPKVDPLFSIGLKANYTPIQQKNNQVLFADYDMVQAEIAWMRNNSTYAIDKTPIVQLFNNYFGGDMSAIVFQTIRESKALAYSTYAMYITPTKKENPFYFVGYVGTQADKIHETIKAMNELINDLPKADKLLADVKTSIRKDIEADRIIDENIILNYLKLKRLGIDYDIRKDVYNQVNNFTYADLKQFAQQEIANKPYTYCIVASAKKINVDGLKQYGEVKQLTLEEIFGY